MEPRSTIGPNPNFDAAKAAECLKKSMKGIGTDEKMIIKVLTEHNSQQREDIEKKYKETYGQDLVDDLKADLGGHFENAVVALMTQVPDLLVTAVHKSFRVTGSDANVLTEILCGKDTDTINSLTWWYEKNFSQSLYDALDANLTGVFKTLMLSIVAKTRADDDGSNIPEVVQDDAQKLYDAGIAIEGTEETVFINLLCSRSYAHLKEVFQEYEKISNESIETSIGSEFTGDVKDGLLAIVKHVKDPHGFFAERLNKSMLGAGTDDETLIRIIVSRSEEDLGNIADRYLEMYGTSLANDIKEDTSGDYAKLLTAILNGSPHPTAPSRPQTSSGEMKPEDEVDENPPMDEDSAPAYKEDTDPPEITEEGGEDPPIEEDLFSEDKLAE